MNRPPAPEDLADLPRVLDPPRGLEERVFAALRRRRLVRPRPPRRFVPWGVAAACLVAAVFGWTARGLIETSAAGPAETDPAAEAALAEGGDFLLLLLEPVPLETSKSLESLIGEYRAWAEGLAEEGRLVTAGRLEREGRYLPAESESPSAGIAPASGFFVVRSGSLAEAEGIAATCPHLRYGGEISVRQVARARAAPES